MSDHYVYHHGILGQKWGVRRYQNEDGSLTTSGKIRQRMLEKKDERWSRHNSEKITKNIKSQVQNELDEYGRNLINKDGAYKTNGRLSSATITAYNRKMAELMNNKVSGLQAPSGRIVQFVAKRGELGVFMALTDQGYNMDQLKNGVYGSGKVAYRKTVLDKVET